MGLKKHFELLGTYNQWMNSKVYEAAGRLDANELARDRGAFFGSITGTLNHLVVGDTVWLKRFATLPACAESLAEIVRLPHPDSLDQILFEDFTELSGHRAWMDRLIIDWVDALTDDSLEAILSYRSMKGIPAAKRFADLVHHFFNHQTHHRGQVSTLLTQAGVDVGVTDLLVLIPDRSQQ